MALNTKIIASQQKDVYKFVEDIKVGTYGEYTLKKYFKRYYPDLILEDKSDVSTYQSADIDLLLQDNKGRTRSIEVKNDRTLYKNLFYEIVSVRKDEKHDTPGCLIVTEADYLVYIYQAIQVALVVPVTYLNKWVDDYLSDGKNIRFGKASVSNENYEAEGYKIPVKTLLGESYGINGVDGIVLIDIQENKRLTYFEYETKRNSMHSELEGAWYSTIYDSSNWEEDNKSLYPNKNKLNVELLDKEVRLAQSRRKLRYLNAIYNKQNLITKDSY